MTPIKQPVRAALPQSIVSFGTNNTFTNVSVGDITGGDIIKTCNTILNPAPPPHIERYPDAPIAPRPLRNFLDRKTEQTRLQGELLPYGGAWVHGPDGCGITALLRQAANLSATYALPDGVAFLDGTLFQAPLDSDGAILPLSHDEIAQYLFDYFYTSSDPTQNLHMTLRQAGPYLRNLQALFVFDRLPINYANLIQLTNVLSKGAVLIGADGAAPNTLLDLPLRSLPPYDALKLFLIATDLDPVQAESAALIKQLIAGLDAQPLPLLLAAHLFRTKTATLSQLVAALALMDISADPLTRALNLVLRWLSDVERTILAALVGAGGPNVSLEALKEICQYPIAELEQALARLVDLRIMTVNAGRYAVSSISVRLILNGLLQPAEERKRAAAFFATAVALHPGNLGWLAQELGNLLAAAQTALAHGQAEQVAALVKGMHPLLVLRGRWDRWGEVIEWSLQAADATGNQALRAWALHERGTRAGLLRDLTTAQADLSEALRLRCELNDQAGALVSRHNLAYLGLLPPILRPSIWKIMTTIIIALILIGGSFIVPPLFSQGEAPAVLPAAMPILPATSTPTPTLTSTENSTPTDIPTATDTVIPSPTDMATLSPLLLQILADERLSPVLTATNKEYETEQPGFTPTLSLALNQELLISIRQQARFDILTVDEQVINEALETGLVAQQDVQPLACLPPSYPVPDVPLTHRNPQYWIAPSVTTAYRDQAEVYITYLIRLICTQQKPTNTLTHISTPILTPEAPTPQLGLYLYRDHVIARR
ncbi:MAG: hypothetical protein MI924_28135 [Chloroflexales bacterium]|nr:hypothetical protein [Chloroflexales bacterium]